MKIVRHKHYRKLYRIPAVRSNYVRRNNKSLAYEAIFLLVSMLAVLFIIYSELRLIRTELLIRDIITETVNYDTFREYKISEDILKKAEDKASDIKQRKPELKEIPYIDDVGYLTFSMMARSYNLLDFTLIDEKTFFRGIGRVATTDAFKELYKYNYAIINDLEYFPVPKILSADADITYEDSWYDPRSYGGKRNHEGTDLMATNNIRGYFPVISITDGIVEKMGWLDQGGYRIGIRSESGGYFYYAHLESYAPELKQGDVVIAGQLLGFMGDSGYGSEGTVGQFDVHLHMGIYVNTNSGEMSVNPYWILRILEKNRIYYNNR